jgi:hypothetical protein
MAETTRRPLFMPALADLRRLVGISPVTQLQTESLRLRVMRSHPW